MDFLPSDVMDNESYVPFNSSNDSFIFNYNNTADIADFLPAPSKSPTSGWDMEYVINGLIIPSIAVFGIFGNLLNLIILSWRYNKREVDVLEKGALLGLIALALSDMLFCMVIFPHAFFYKQKTAFSSATFRMYYHVYGLYFQNVFIKTSTFLTLVVGVARYVGICHPLRARLFIGLNGMRAACVITYVLWFALMCPMLWMHSIQEYHISNTSTMYILDTGPFAKYPKFNLTFTYIWAFLGYFIPLAVLTFCNVNLIKALRQSMRLREATVRSNTANRDVSTRITLTLIVLIVMFMVLVSPSELLHFVLEVFEKEQYRSFEVAIMLTNVLQAINFAFHFVLYCVVNVTFRRTILSVLYVMLNWIRKTKTSQNSGGKYHHSLIPMNGNTTRGSFKSSCRTSITRMADVETYV